MEKNSQNVWQEIVFGSSNSQRSQAIRRAIKAGQLNKLAPRLYTSNLKDKPATIIRRNLYTILSNFFPNAVLSHRTALEGMPFSKKVIILTYKYTKKLTLPGLTIRLFKGSLAVEGDTILIGKLFLASRTRALLENLQPSRDRGISSKVLSRSEIEEYMDKLCLNYGVEELGRLRDLAKPLAKKLNLNKEYNILHQIIGMNFQAE